MGGRLEHHLRRSYTQGDDNFDAQLLYGRQLFINGKLDDSRQVFDRLRNARVGSNVRNRLTHELGGEFEGRVARREASYCFISRDGVGDRIYAHSTNMSDSAWSLITIGSRIRFKIAFNFKGASAFGVVLLDPVAVPKQPQMKLFSKTAAPAQQH